MTLEFIKYIVNKEEDFIEDDVDKIKAHLTVVSKIREDVNNELPLMTFDLIIINLNSQTGIEIDEQRLAASIEFVNNKFK